jgi:hypothetical protein
LARRFYPAFPGFWKKAGAALVGVTTGTVILASIGFYDTQATHVTKPCHFEALDSPDMVNIAGLHPESLLVTCFGWSNNIGPM